MIIKHIFESGDFNSPGQVIVRAHSGNVSSSYITSVSYKIGYDPRKRGSHTLISLSDGQTQFFENEESLIESLNKDPIGFRPIEKREWDAIWESNGNRFSS